LDDNDFKTTNIVAGTLIQQVGKDREPTVLSKKENVDAFF